MVGAHPERSAVGPAGPPRPPRTTEPVLAVLDTPTSFEALLAALVIGALSGLVLALACALALRAPVASAWPVTAGGLSALLSMALLPHGTRRAGVVLVRGALLGALEWQALAVLAARAAGASGGSGGEPAQDLVTRLAGAPADVMFWVCLVAALLGWAWVRVTPGPGAAH